MERGRRGADGDAMAPDSWKHRLWLLRLLSSEIMLHGPECPYPQKRASPALLGVPSWDPCSGKMGLSSQ